MNSYKIMHDQRRTQPRRRKGAEVDFIFSMGFSMIVGAMLGATIALLVVA